MPRAGHALERVRAALLETNTGGGHQVIRYTQEFADLNPNKSNESEDAE
jgi:hypothetical protein